VRNRKQDTGKVFRRFDAGASARSKGGDKNDCQVRALATARGIAYNEAYNLLYRIQGERGWCSFCLVEALGELDPRLDVVRRLDFPAVKGKPRMTGRAFCAQYPCGRFILRMSHHVAAVVDGVLTDTFDSSEKCVYLAWEIAEAARGTGT
jgi:hypothetical protein